MKTKPSSQMSTVNPMAAPEEDENASNVGAQNQRPGIFKLLAAFAALAFMGSAFFLAGRSSAEQSSAEEGEKESPPTSGSQPQDPRTVFVHLFEWKWTDIEKECVTFLGPKGFSAVQVSPPNEHVDHKFVKDFAWWSRYQPVTYDLSSRSGSRAEFISMVKTCKNVGVDIYVDAVINHVAMEPVGKGVAGSVYSKDTLTYPFYSAQDFNFCDPAQIQGSDYGNNPWRVRHCQLNGLPDLNHDSDYVMSKIIGYLQDLIDIGVAGLRIDASKHMEPHHVSKVLDSLRGNPYVFLEVIDYGTEAIKFTDYDLSKADVTEFKYTGDLTETFAQGKLSWLYNFGEDWSFMSALSAVVFTDNHDNQRGHGRFAQVTHRDGALYDITNVFMLAWPYGYPKVMSSYDWGGVNDDLGPPSDSQGNTLDVHTDGGGLRCFGSDWICEHRWRPIANMVAFRNYATGRAGYDITNWWDNGNNQIAFSRSAGDRALGFVVINREGFEISNLDFFTGLPDGVYCDVISSEFDSATRTCAGKTVTVNGGWATISVNSISAVAIYGGAML